MVKENANQSLKIAWGFLQVLSIVLFVLACAVADTMDNAGAGFAAVWSMFILCGICILGSHILGHCGTTPINSKLMVGFWIGGMGMTSMIFFILGVIFASFDADQDKALGAMYIIGWIIMGGYAIGSYFKRTELWMDADGSKEPGPPSKSTVGDVPDAGFAGPPGP